MTISHPTTSAAPAANSAEALRHRKLADAAEQFEGMFLQQLLKSKGVDREDASASDEQGTSVGGGMYKDFGNDFVARSIAKAGGLGIARRIIAQVERASPTNISAQS